MNYTLILGCLAGAAAAIFVSSKLFRHPFSPFSIFYCTWFIAMAAYHMNWIAYVPVRRSGWTVIAISMVTFALGWMIPYLAWNPKTFALGEIVRSKVSAERFFLVIVICFVLGGIAFLMFLYVVNQQLGIASFVLAPSEIRESMSTKGGLVEPLKPLSWLNVANVALCTYYLFGIQGPRRRWVWLILAMSLLELPMLQDRIHFFFAAVWAGSVLLYSVRVTLRKLVAVAAIGMALLLAQFFAVAYWLGKVAENNPILMDVANVEGTQVLMLAPYMYLTVSLPALQVHLDSSPRPTHGAMTFYPIFQVVHQIDPTLEPPPVVSDFVAVPSPANTFTWLQQFYDDFGIAGIWIGPWVIGILTSFFYFHMLSNRDVYSTLMSGVFSFCLALSIYGNHFTQGPAWYFLAVCFLIDRFVRKKVAPPAMLPVPIAQNS